MHHSNCSAQNLKILLRMVDTATLHYLFTWSSESSQHYQLPLAPQSSPLPHLSPPQHVPPHLEITISHCYQAREQTAHMIRVHSRSTLLPPLHLLLLCSYNVRFCILLLSLFALFYTHVCYEWSGLHAIQSFLNYISVPIPLALLLII